MLNRLAIESGVLRIRFALRHTRGPRDLDFPSTTESGTPGRVGVGIGERIPSVVESGLIEVQTKFSDQARSPGSYTRPFC